MHQGAVTGSAGGPRPSLSICPRVIQKVAQLSNPTMPEEESTSIVNSGHVA
jgi:hypothetical protein